MRHALLLPLAALIAAPSLAAAPTSTDQPRMLALTVFGNDPCPKSTDEEIVVCAREPEGERYRLPKRFREKQPLAAQGSWANTARELEMVSRKGLPNGCSPIGTYGQTGCFAQFLAANRREPDEKP